jgi:hypothetical protein
MLTGLFRPQTFLEEGLQDWCLETWAWLMRNLGGLAAHRNRPLVLANTDFFPPTTTEGEARAAFLFDRVKDLMGMADWECVLRPLDAPPSSMRVGEFWSIQTKTPGGTFQARHDGQVVISYAAELLNDPRRLVAVLAHELCHYRLATIEEPSPGGVEAYEMGTDLAVAFFGFGAFGANAAFAFKQYTDTFGQGWSSRRSGYLSERTWAFATALFLTIKDQPGAAKTALKPSIAELTEKAERYLKRNPALTAPLLAIL